MNTILCIDGGRCTACGACVDLCPVGALHLPTGGPVQVSEACIGCGACLDACPTDALSLPTVTSTPTVPAHGIWIVGEHRDGTWHPVVAELVGAASRLQPAQPVQVVAAGAPGCHRRLLGGLAGLPLTGVQFLEHPDLDPHRDGATAAALAWLVRRQSPAIILAGATDRGRALMPRLAALLATGLTADCTGLALDPATGDLLQTRPAFGGNILATIRTARHRPQMATVRPSVFTACAPDLPHPVPPMTIQVPTLFDDPLRVLGIDRTSGTSGGIAEARVLVAAGRGLGSAAGLPLVRQLAERLGGTVAASRAAVEAGWVEESRQVGQTGRCVHPDLYVAIGISGAVQHLAGIAGAHRVVAINRDPQAPILDRADHALIGDWRDILTAWLALPTEGR